MFTGIIRHTGTVTKTAAEGEGKRFTIGVPKEFAASLEAGITSVAIDGACHTVERASADSFETFSSYETLKRTTVGSLKTGSRVNLELPVTMNTLLDGHLVQGHVDGAGRIVAVEQRGEARVYRFEADRGIADYLVEKDSVAVDGISLTIASLGETHFEVAVIPQTVKHTTLADKKAGSEVNLEVNLFAKYAKKFAAGDGESSKLENWLKS